MYMTFYRARFPEVRIIPKQHILEAHCVRWIRRWGFGLALHGEQGGEVNSEQNKTKSVGHEK